MNTDPNNKAEEQAPVDGDAQNAAETNETAETPETETSETQEG